MKEKNEIEQLLKFNSSILNNKFCKLVEPLGQCFGLNGFFYSKITIEGYFFQIGNLPKLTEYYFSSQFYKHNPFIRHPNNYFHNQFILSMDNPDKISREQQQQVEKRYGVGNTLIIYKKTDDALHVFMPTSTQPDFPLNTVYLNNFSALNQFADYFLNEWAPHQSKMESYMFNLEEHIGPLFFKKNHAKFNGPNNSEREQFLRQIGAIKSTRTDISKLSKREKDCVNELVKGKTASQIGAALNLGRRTVEYYLENIKTKLDCYTKPELVEKLQAFKAHGLL